MFKEPSFLKKANLFQPILVVVISIIGGTPMEGANTGKIVLLVILGAAFIVWHVECQRLINRNREMKKQACTLKNRSAALYKKTYAALSGEYENFANKLNGENRREKKSGRLPRNDGKLQLRLPVPVFHHRRSPGRI